MNARIRLILMTVAIAAAITANAQTGNIEAPEENHPSEPERPSLIAEIPERNIRLYGTSDSVVLQIGDRERAFDWAYMTPRMIMPVMHAADFDADGDDELAIILHVGSGTGIAIDELHIVEFDESGLMEDHLFAESDYIAQLDEHVRFRTSGPSDAAAGAGCGASIGHAGSSHPFIGEIAVGSRTYPVNLDAFASGEFGNIIERLIFGNIVRFGAEDRTLNAEFEAGIGFEQIVTPQYIGTLHAQVDYRDGRFHLADLIFEPYPEFPIVEK